MPDASEDNAHPSVLSRPPTTFFTLSRELRDYCYDLALNTPLPIVAWSGIRSGNEPRNKNFFLDDDLEKAKEYKATTSDLRALVPNLLRCNSQVAYEAALIFYGRNRFFFLGDWTWETVLSWWKKIGPTNRGFVSLLELRIYRPSQAYERPDGERIDVAISLEPAFPRSPYLFRSLDSRAEGYVENFNPAIEEFFQLLNNPPRDTRKLLITMSLHNDFLPGFRLSFDENDYWPWQYWFTMDLPNLMEKLREKTSNIEVLWKGFAVRDNFLAKKANIKKLWEIISAVEEDLPVPNRPSNGEPRPPWKYIRFVVKRREITGLLLAAEPVIKEAWM